MTASFLQAGTLFSCPIASRAYEVFLLVVGCICCTSLCGKLTVTGLRVLWKWIPVYWRSGRSFCAVQRTYRLSRNCVLNRRLLLKWTPVHYHLRNPLFRPPGNILLWTLGRKIRGNSHSYRALWNTWEYHHTSYIIFSAGIWKGICILFLLKKYWKNYNSTRRHGLILCGSKMRWGVFIATSRILFFHI